MVYDVRICYLGIAMSVYTMLASGGGVWYDIDVSMVYRLSYSQTLLHSLCGCQNHV